MPSLREAGAVSSRALQPWCGFRLSHRRMGSRRRSTFVRFAGDQIRGEQITACRASRACHLFLIKRVLLARSHSLGLLILCGCFALSRQSGGEETRPVWVAEPATRTICSSQKTVPRRARSVNNTENAPALKLPLPDPRSSACLFRFPVIRL